MELILKVRELIALARAGDFYKSVALALEILTLITKSLDPNSPRPFFTAAPVDASVSELCCSMEAECVAMESSAAAPSGGLGTILLPLILALLKKLLLG